MTERSKILRCIVDLQDFAERAEARGQHRTPEVMRRAATLLARGLTEAPLEHPVVIIDQETPQ